MATFKAPKTIANHPAVAACVPGESQGSDYRFWVFLKPGHTFKNGRMAGCSGGAGFSTVANFLYAMGEGKPLVK